MDAVTVLHTEIRELVRRRGVDPLTEPEVLSALVDEARADYLSRADAGLVPPLTDPEAASAYVLDSLAGLGPLQPYLEDESVEEIWVNSASRVFVARSGRPELTTTILEDEDLRVLVERMLAPPGPGQPLRGRPAPRWGEAPRGHPAHYLRGLGGQHP